MNTTRQLVISTRLLCLVLPAFLSISCSTCSKSDAADWNHLKIWHQVATNPPTYIPAGYGAGKPRTERDGTWFTDTRDGKRLFVPKTPVRGLEPGVLTGEAKKVTGNKDKPRLSPGKKAWWVFMTLIAGLARTELPPPDW